MKIRMLVFIFIILISFTNRKQVLAISAESYCVIDAKFGTVLNEKNAYLSKGMASTTKIMTALVALEFGKSHEIATVSHNAASAIGSSLYLKPGEKIKVYDLICGLMLNSGNDAAIVLAEHLGGSVENFVKSMNLKAKELGAKSTHFVNPNGLSDPNHYTTAYDLAIITAHALKNVEFKKIVSTKAMQIETVGEEKRTLYLHNHNKLLSVLDGCDGVKTGYTKATGRCLVSSVSRDGMQTICVTLNASDDWNDHISLHNSAQNEFESAVMVENGQNFGEVAVLGGSIDKVRCVASQTLSHVIRKNTNQSIRIETDVLKEVKAPVELGQKLGKVSVYLDGQYKDGTDLIAERCVDTLPVKRYAEILFLLFTKIF